MDAYFLEKDRTNGPVWKRIAILAVALMAYQLSASYLLPVVSRFANPLTEGLEPGPRLLIRHAFTFSLPMAVVAGFVILALVKAGIFHPLSFNRNARQALLQGLIAGLLISAATVPFWLLFGHSFQLEINLWSVFGNLFSNGYEELTYRAMIVPAGLYCFRNKWAALALSGAVFAYSHGQYPLALQLYTGVVGAVFALVYWRTGNLLAPWLAHQVADMILDTILKF